MEQIRSADVLANFPQVDEEKLNAALAAEAAASNRKIIVLDDDPTGVQTVHDIYVYTDWTVESLRKGFAAPEKLFFILTNSRGFTVAETTKAHREIAENTAKVAREFGMDYLIISRGDSTLRGHYPLETDLLREVTEAENGYKMDGDILCPYFREGGRFTLDNVHYVRYGAELVPCGQTEFAKDETFGAGSAAVCPPHPLRRRTVGVPCVQRPVLCIRTCCRAAAAGCSAHFAAAVRACRAPDPEPCPAGPCAGKHLPSALRPAYRAGGFPVSGRAARTALPCQGRFLPGRCRTDGPPC